MQVKLHIHIRLWVGWDLVHVSILVADLAMVGGAKKTPSFSLFFFAQHAWTEINFIHIKDEMALNLPVDG